MRTRRARPWARRWALLEAARAEGVPALFRRTDRLDRDRTEVLIDGSWLLCRDLLLVRAGAPAALLSDPARAEPLAAEARLWTDDALVAVIGRVPGRARSADPQCDVAADGRDGDEPSAGPSRLRISMTEQIDEWLIGIRTRDTVPADDFKLVEDLAVTVGDIVLVETGSGTALGEVRRPRRAVPDFKRDRLFRRVVRIATDAETREYRDRRQREERAIATAQRVVRSREMPHEGRGRGDVRPRAPGDRLLQRRGPRSISATWCAISPASSARAWRCGRSAPATRRA